jgi:NAD-dependent histone deacetylase SIR2
MAVSPHRGALTAKTEYPDDLMKESVQVGQVPHCLVPQCNGLVKPDIVFFGEALPAAFFTNRHVPGTADMIIVMGTSLSVQPFASLPSLAKPGAPRVLFNMERVGDFGSRPDDVVVLGDCDEGVRKLAEALGWLDELELLWRDVGGNVKEKEAIKRAEETKGMTKDEILEAEIGKLTGEIDSVLKLSKDLAARANDQLDTDSNTAQISSTPSISGLETSQSEGELRGVASTSPTPPILGSEGGLKEPPTTPANGENRSANTERMAASVLEQAPAVDKERIDVTLPQNKPGSGTE